MGRAAARRPADAGSARLRSVDALRGAAALAVLYHAANQTPRGSGFLTRFVAGPAHTVVAQGYAGVFLFFVISGFCIHLNWARARAAGRSERVEFLPFWRRRVLRLYPPYLVALALYLSVARATGHLPLDAFFAWDLSAHLLMLHNFDARTCYSINSVFWTLAIEEQLYLAYFLLLFLRRRWGWAATLACCFAARAACLVLLNALRGAKGIDIPVAEAAASHWFTWALGALAVESAFGLVTLPRWCRDLRIAAALLVAAPAFARLLDVYESSRVWHDYGWLLLHPLWGLGFFVVLNRAVHAERGWRERGALPRPVAWLAGVGLVSYSLYLTHPLVLLEAWRFESAPLPAPLIGLLVMTPLSVAFAWLFFRLFERPCLSRAARRKARPGSDARVPRVRPASREGQTPSPPVAPEAAL